MFVFEQLVSGGWRVVWCTRRAFRKSDAVIVDVAAILVYYANSSTAGSALGSAIDGWTADSRRTHTDVHGVVLAATSWVLCILPLIQPFKVGAILVDAVWAPRLLDATKAKAIQGSAGAPSEGERDAHELLRTLVKKTQLTHPLLTPCCVPLLFLLLTLMLLLLL